MTLNKAVLKAKERYSSYTTEEKREVTKLVTGDERPERIVLNPKTKIRRKR
ncbi:MAG: hypothetical protein SOY04_12665 [Clostridium celatum]|nr:hypothetical protein [Clostridium celatum]